MKNNKKPHKDQELFLLFCQGEEAAIIKIYTTCYPPIKKMVIINSGTEADAEDVFQEGLQALLNYCGKDFTLYAPLKSLLYGICRRIWLKKLEKRGKSGVTFTDTWEYTVKDHILRKEEKEAFLAARNALIYKHLRKLEPREQRLIELFHLEGWSLEAIAEEMGFADANSAKAQKSKYMKKLRDRMQNDPDYE